MMSNVWFFSFIIRSEEDVRKQANMVSKCLDSLFYLSSLVCATVFLSVSV